MTKDQGRETKHVHLDSDHGSPITACVSPVPRRAGKPSRLRERTFPEILFGGRLGLDLRGLFPYFRTLSSATAEERFRLPDGVMVAHGPLEARV